MLDLPDVVSITPREVAGPVSGRAAHGTSRKDLHINEWHLDPHGEAGLA